MSENELIGEKAGRWELVQLLGRGGFCRGVYRAVDTDGMLSEVAVKLIPAYSVATNAFHELDAVLDLPHPNIVAYRDSGKITTGKAEGHYFIAFELCERSLYDLLYPDGSQVPFVPLASEAARRVGQDITTGLAKIHQSHRVHRDIKPGNILQLHGVWKLADFGLARLIESDKYYPITDSIRGTFAYIAPEVFNGEHSRASDIYSVGATLHRGLTGENFHTGASIEVFIANVRTRPPHISDNLPDQWRAIITACCEKAGSRPSAEELLRMFEPADANGLLAPVATKRTPRPEPAGHAPPGDSSRRTSAAGEPAPAAGQRLPTTRHRHRSLRALIAAIVSAILVLILVVLFIARGVVKRNGTSTTTVDLPPATAPPVGTTTAVVPAPWSASPLSLTHVPQAIPNAWSTSAARAACPAMAFDGYGIGEGGVARVANSPSAWIVAWDKPGTPGQLANGAASPTAGRSTFGILGTSAPATSVGNWPYRLTWLDGSVAGYGYEGGISPSLGPNGSPPNPLRTTKWLAELRISGINCLYNVWSNLGKSHLEDLLGRLRFVATAG